jgi:hypothetical protein
MIDIKQASVILGVDDASARIVLRFFKVRTVKSEAVAIGKLKPKPKNLYDETQVREIAGLRKY